MPRALRRVQPRAERAFPSGRPGAQVLKVFAEPLLAAVQPHEPTYAKAAELLQLLALVNAASPATVKQRTRGPRAPGRARRAPRAHPSAACYARAACGRRCPRPRCCASSSATARSTATSAPPDAYLGHSPDWRRQAWACACSPMARALGNPRMPTVVQP